MHAELDLPPPQAPPVFSQENIFSNIKKKKNLLLF